MVIGSSSIGMESARRFTSVSMEASRLTTWNNSGLIGQISLGTLDTENSVKRTLFGEKDSTFQNSMKNLMERF